MFSKLRSVQLQRQKRPFEKRCLFWFEKNISELPSVVLLKPVFVQQLSYENEFDLHENEPVDRTYEWFPTKTRFETEAKGNSEIAYSFYSQ